MKKFMLHKAGKANADCINVARLGKVEAQNNKSNQRLQLLRHRLQHRFKARPMMK